MSAIENLNIPLFANPIDDDLDAIRNHFNFALMIAANGSLLLPGWNTSVVSNSSPIDYSEPSQMVLTRGTRRIIFNYTWSGGSVASIQMCYDDGVSSPGLVCFDAINITYDAAGNLNQAG